MLRCQSAVVLINLHPTSNSPRWSPHTCIKRHLFASVISRQNFVSKFGPSTSVLLRCTSFWCQVILRVFTLSHKTNSPMEKPFRGMLACTEAREVFNMIEVAVPKVVYIQFPINFEQDLLYLINPNGGVPSHLGLLYWLCEKRWMHQVQRVAVMVGPMDSADSVSFHPLNLRHWVLRYRRGRGTYFLANPSFREFILTKRPDDNTTNRYPSNKADSYGFVHLPLTDCVSTQWEEFKVEDVEGEFFGVFEHDRPFQIRWAIDVDWDRCRDRKYIRTRKA